MCGYVVMLWRVLFLKFILAQLHMYSTVTLSLCSDRSSMLAITTYFIYSFAIIAFEEVYPLWCATPRYAGESKTASLVNSNAIM